MVRSERGMTLLELLVVVGILGTISLLTIPDFVAWRKQAQYRQAARDMVDLMRQARTRAATRNLEQRVEIEVLNRRYRLVEGDRPTHSTDFATVVIDWVDLPQAVALKKNLACNSDADSKLQFNPSGTAQSGYVCIVEADSPEVCHFKVGVASSTCGRAVVRKD